MEARPQRHYRPPPPSATLISQAPPVEFSTKEEAEKAFFKLLRETVSSFLFTTKGANCNLILCS